MTRQCKGMVIKMEELRERLADFLSDKLYQIIVSNPRRKDEAFKIKIRPVVKKDGLCFQETISKGTQVFHENHSAQEMQEKIIAYMEDDFRQLEGSSMDGKLTVLVSKKGKTTVKYQKNEDTASKVKPDMSHNRTKQYILKEGVPVPFLVDLGV